MRRHVLLGLISILFVTFVASAHAQIVTASLTGTVRDETGAVIPGATITTINQETGLSRQVLTNEIGDYVVSDLKPGRYALRAELTGFKAVEFNNVVLHMEQKARVDFMLSLGELTKTVTVEATAVLLESENAALGQVVDEKRVVDLPLNGRSFIQLAAITSGAVPQSTKPGGQGVSLLGGQTQRSNVTASIAGQRETNVSFLLDGMDTRNVWHNGPSVIPSVDAIKEFKVQKNHFSAQYGSASAVISASIKSGTNEFHGTAFEFHRNNHLDAREFFDIGRPPEFKLNQFGGSIGGPIRKERTFFFFDYEGLRQRRANTVFATVPPPEFLSGDFSGFSLPIYDPLSVDAQGDKIPFPGNRIPAERLSQAARKFNAFIPRPNGSGLRDNLITTPTVRRGADQYHARIDHKLGPHDDLFGRWSLYNDDIFQPGIAKFFGRVVPLFGRNLVLQEPHVFSSKLLNVFKFSYNRGRFFNATEPTGGRNFLEELGLRGIRQRREDFTLPTFGISGFSSLGNTRSRGGIHESFALDDAITLTRSNHVLNLGFTLSFNRFQELQNTNNNGVLAYDGRYSSLPGHRLSAIERSLYALADYLLGYPNQAQFAPDPVIANWRYRNFAVYLQDDWKVHPRLTLNLGVRYEYETPWIEIDDKIGIYAPEIGRVIYGRTPRLIVERGIPPALRGLVRPEPAARRSLIDPDWNNLAPRFGLAFRATDDLVIRSGYGVYYVTTVGKEHEFLMKAPPYVINTQISGNPGNLQPNIFQDDLFPDVFNAETPDVSPFSQFQRQRTGYVQQWNLSLQRRLFSEVLFEAAYTGSKGTKLYTRWNQNQAVPGPGPVNPRRPIPGFGDILTSTTAAASNYHAMQLRVEKTFSRGFSLLAAYTLGKVIDDFSGGEGAAYHQDINNRRADRGLGDIDIRQRFVLSYLWELPFGRQRRWGQGLHGMLGHLASGWQFNGIVAFQSGSPISIAQPGGFQNVGGFQFARPDRIADGRLPKGQRSTHRWFDPDAFEAVRNRFGNSGRNVIIGPGLNNFDLSLFKNTRIGERANIQFRVELFNAFNHPNFNHPVGDAASINFATIRSTLPSREIQFGLKVIF